jgi:hypothetical protein
MTSNPPNSRNALCDLILLDSERHELLQAYERRKKMTPYPPMAIQLFMHIVRNNSAVTVYLNHADDLWKFANEMQIEWLEEHIVETYRKFRSQSHANAKAKTAC